MSGAILDGKRINHEILGELKPRIEALKKKARPPALAVVLVGDDAASQIYVRNKIKTCAELGIRSLDSTPGASISTEELLRIIDGFNRDPETCAAVPFARVCSGRGTRMVRHLMTALRIVDRRPLSVILTSA